MQRRMTRHETKEITNHNTYMKIRTQAILFSAVALALCSCSEENPWSQAGEGGLRVQLTTNGEVKDAVPLLRSGSMAPDVPEVSDFAITLTKNSTGETTEFSSVDELNSKESFSAGSYKVAAHYGTTDTEGFAAPYYYGEADVTVLEGRQSEVSITAGLASAMVSLDYSDTFKNYFKDYSATVHSEGHDFITFAKDEIRPAYIQPGEVALTVNVTNHTGKSANLQLASFPTSAAHHYHITLEVNNGNMGQAQLQITFDDTLDKEDVVIDLTDELFTSTGPTVYAIGFNDGDVFETVEGSSLPEAVKYNISAPAGLKSATLTISGAGLNAPFGNEVDLCQADANTFAQLNSYGITVKGLSDEDRKYVVVDLTGLPSKLPEGTYVVSLVAQDKFLRACEPISVKFSSYPVVFEATAGEAVMNSNRTVVAVEYNGNNPANEVSFKALNKHGIYEDCQILGMVEATRTRAIESKTYNFEIQLPDTDRPEVPIEVYLSGSKKIDLSVKVTAPEYSFRADGFSKFAAIKIDAANPSQLGLITGTVKVFVNGVAVAENRLNRNEETGVITITGLEPSNSYALQTSIYPDGGASGDKVEITTENATDVPNGNFSAVTQTINRSNVEVGGKYSYTVKYQATSNIVRSEADGWASINAKTCWFDAPGAKNTWFQVPSTYAENGHVVLRNVAYDHNGVKPADMPSGIGKTYWYNTNTPTFTTSAAGELFLGTYSFDGSEHRTDGISFDSRPSSLTFDYSYVPTGSDTGKAEIAVYDAAGSVIASGNLTLDASSSMKNVSIPLTGYRFGSKAARIVVRFLSSGGTAPYHVPQGSELSEGFGAGNFGNKNLGDNNYHAVATGSVLTLDNVKLNY